MEKNSMNSRNKVNNSSNLSVSFGIFLEEQDC